MIGPVHFRLMSGTAAIAFWLCCASAPLGAQGDMPRSAKPERETPRTDAQGTVTPQSHTPQSPAPQSETPERGAQQSDTSQRETQQKETPPPPASEQEEANAPEFGPKTAQATAEAARRYAEIAASGGWARIAKPVSPAAKGKPVIDLRRRLAAENFLSREDATAPVWDAKLKDALKRFQSQMGLEETGTVTPSTLRELNVSAAERTRALQATAERLSKMKFGFGERYVDVNIPAAEAESVENGHSVQRFTAIVGGPKHPSPQIVTKIISVLINPAWTVPVSIVKRELLPALRRNPAYLSREHMRVFDGRGQEIDLRRLRGLPADRAAMFTFRQDPGPKNSLGSIHLDMPNKDEVYMHDTPNKVLFERDYRFLSHGCVRVEGIYDLATWLLQEPGQPGQWDQAALKSKIDEGKTETIKLRRPTPVAWVYMTGWASDDGKTHFRHDIYDLDKGVGLPPTGPAQQKTTASTQRGAPSGARVRR